MEALSIGNTLFRTNYFLFLFFHAQTFTCRRDFDFSHALLGISTCLLSSIGSSPKGFCVGSGAMLFLEFSLFITEAPTGHSSFSLV